MARERVEYDVVGRDQGGSKAFKDVGDAADQAADKVEGLGKASADAGDQVEGLGDKARTAGEDAGESGKQWKGLAAEIEATQGRMRELAKEIDRTGNLDLSKDLRRQQSELRKLMRFKDIADQAGDDAAKGFAARFIARLGPVMASAPLNAGAAGGIGAAVGGPIVAGVAAWLSTAAVGAVLGGAAVGAVAGGITVAARDGRVQAAGAELADAIGSQLEDAAAPMVPATLQAIGKVRVEAEELGEVFDDIFGDAAGYVGPLTDALLGFGSGALRGLRDLVRGAEPVVDMLRSQLPEFGDEIGESLSTLAEHGPEAARALGMLLEVAGAGLQTVTQVLGVAADAFKWADLIGSSFRGPQAMAETASQYAVAAEQAEDGTTDWGAALDGIIPKLDAATAETKSFQEQLRELRDNNLNAAQTQIQFEETIDRVTAAAKRAKNTIDVNTAAGRENRQMLLDLVADTKSHAQAILEQTGSHDLAAQATERGRAAFMKAAAAMKVEKGEAESLANQLFGIPDVNRTVTVDTAQAEKNVRWLKTQISGIPRHIFIKAEFDLINDAEVAMALRLGRLSGGGPVVGTGPKGVDSQLYLLAPGEHVLTAREVDAAGGHEGVEQIRAALRGEAPAGAPARAAGGRRAPARRGPGDVEAMAAALVRALSSVRLVLDDRTGKTAHLEARLGG